LRVPVSVVSFAALGVSLGVQLFGSLPHLVRLGSGLLGLVMLAAAVDAWLARVVVGTDGIRVRAVFSRKRIFWDEVARFYPARSPRPGHLAPRVALRDGTSMRLSDYDLPSRVTDALIRDLSEEYERLGVRTDSG
jgi:hypothetical protein